MDKKVGTYIHYIATKADGRRAEASLSFRPPKTKTRIRSRGGVSQPKFEEVVGVGDGELGLGLGLTDAFSKGDLPYFLIICLGQQDVHRSN